MPTQTPTATFTLGTRVVNFGTLAQVVGFFERGDMAGWPILKALGASGKPKGGKWVADPTKCEVA